MKLLSIISHPYALVASFFLIIIGGQQIDQFYLQFLLSGLRSGAWHSVAGITGISLILFSHLRFGDGDKSLEAHLTNLLGVILLVLSLFLFFYAGRDTLVAETFNQGIFLTSMTIFCIFVTCFITIL